MFDAFTKITLTHWTNQLEAAQKIAKNNIAVTTHALTTTSDTFQNITSAHKPIVQKSHLPLPYIYIPKFPKFEFDNFNTLSDIAFSMSPWVRQKPNFGPFSDIFQTMLKPFMMWPNLLQFHPNQISNMFPWNAFALGSYNILPFQMPFAAPFYAPFNTQTNMLTSAQQAWTQPWQNASRATPWSHAFTPQNMWPQQSWFSSPSASMWPSSDPNTIQGVMVFFTIPNTFFQNQMPNFASPYAHGFNAPQNNFLPAPFDLPSNMKRVFFPWMK